jgi:hypothetical protein
LSLEAAQESVTAVCPTPLVHNPVGVEGGLVLGGGAGTGAGAGAGATIGVGAEVAEVEPFLLEAVTTTLSLEPTSLEPGL